MGSYTWACLAETLGQLQPGRAVLRGLHAEHRQPVSEVAVAVVEDIGCSVGDGSGSELIFGKTIPVEKAHYLLARVSREIPVARGRRPPAWPSCTRPLSVV